VGRTYWNKG